MLFPVQHNLLASSDTVISRMSTRRVIRGDEASPIPQKHGKLCLDEGLGLVASVTRGNHPQFGNSAGRICIWMAT